ncbi:metallophosphoesterase [Streptococcus orisasini]|uniref:metallophosphoesterase n=1 Tax=Streptococcus orisasini TaxID=1080071 RepID=UPI00071015EB|nr:metallophosphoesterase [Streptococcus orisasini]
MAERTLIIMSDSHGDRQIVKEIKERYLGKADAIFHNGDSELPASDPIWEGIQVVCGNCDFGDYPDSLVTDLPGLTVAQTHGHLFNINFGFERLDLWAQEEDADICTYGHLHRPAVWKNGKTVFINPGSVSQPRGEINERLYARVCFDENTIKVDYFTRDHEIYPPLSQEIRR